MKTLVKITDFAKKRHFDSKSGVTKILDKSPEEVEHHINLWLHNSWIYEVHEENKPSDEYYWVKILTGYAPFSKLLVMKNFTDARVGSMSINVANYQYLRTGYSARQDDELPVLSRWFDLPVSKEKAEYLVFAVYSKKHIDREEKIKANKENRDVKPFDAPWGIVSIMGQSHSNEEPMKPITIIRNALGMEEGGSGVSIDKEKYKESVKFWKNNATVR